MTHPLFPVVTDGVDSLVSTVGGSREWRYNIHFGCIDWIQHCQIKEMERGVSGRGACPESHPNNISQQHQRCNLVSTHGKLLLPKVV